MKYKIQETLLSLFRFISADLLNKFAKTRNSFILVQEYGRYFGMKTATFRAGCLTGSSHSGTKLHGFLSYLMKCIMTGKHYQIYGYKGKQVRDNIHSYDLINAFYHFYQEPRTE